jgi:hypothetical protein
MLNPSFAPFGAFMVPLPDVRMEFGAEGYFGYVSIVNGGLNTLNMGTGAQPGTGLEVILPSGQNNGVGLVPSVPGGVNVPSSSALPALEVVPESVQNQDEEKENKGERKAKRSGE